MFTLLTDTCKKLIITFVANEASFTATLYFRHFLSRNFRERYRRNTNNTTNPIIKATLKPISFSRHSSHRDDIRSYPTLQREQRS